MANPGQDQIGRWKAAIAASHKQQRSQRGRRTRGVATVIVGMVRIAAPREQQCIDVRPQQTGGGEERNNMPSVDDRVARRARSAQSSGSMRNSPIGSKVNGPNHSRGQ